MTAIKYKRIFNSSSSGGSGSVSATQITYAALSASLIANTTSEGFYLITDACSASTAGAVPDLGLLVQVYNDANSVNQVRLEAEGVFLNPDFQDVGDYSGVLGLTGLPKGTNQKVWLAAETAYADGDIVFWGGLHYQVTDDGALAGTDPSATPLAYTVLPKATADMGYITESDFVLYNFAADTISSRNDRRGNIVYNSSLATFQFGNNNVEFNTIYGYSALNCINSRSSYIGSNELNGTSVITIDETNEGNFSKNEFLNTQGITFNGTFGLTNSRLYFPGNLSQVIDVSSADIEYKKAGNGFSEISQGFAISGLTTFDFLTYSYAGIINLSSTNATESIDTFTSFPDFQPVRFFPESGLILTFVHNTAANKPRCEGGVNVILNGTNGDWVEFTKMADGFIYQSNIYTG